jgi:hypothetical protein
MSANNGAVNLRSTFEELCGITTQHTTSNVVARLCHTQGSKEVTPSRYKEASSDVTTHCT